MNHLLKTIVLLMTLAITPSITHAFNSGSNGSDGELNVISDTTLVLPPSGIFNFTDVTVVEGVTLTFSKNAANTPVYILASGDVTVEGVIDLDGQASPSTVDGDITDDRQPGVGGPGGFDGGLGGYLGAGTNNDGARGQGPGGGQAATGFGACAGTNQFGVGGGGGGFAANGGNGASGGVGGRAYGVSYLIPLIGGAGGGGGSGSRGIASSAAFGSGGGGGAGAILIAASGTVNISGMIHANGGDSGSALSSTGGGCHSGGSGGAGSGGAIRVVASTLEGSGTIQAIGGIGGEATRRGGNGASGRIRLEADDFQWLVLTTPLFTSSAPNPVFISNLPGIVISSVAGIAAPATPTGFNDIVLPDGTPNPVSVGFSTVDVPPGGIIELTIAPARGSAFTVDSAAIGGSLANGSASASVDLPNGPSTLIATTTFEVTADLGRDFSKYAMGEEVEKVKISYIAGQGSVTTFITAQGNEYPWPTNGS